jgi:phosphoadenosine phosphosulfate reductase
MNHIEKSIMRLKEFEPPEGYYLAFSGGKDSCVLKALADMAQVKYDAHYNWTTVDPPELVRFIKDYHPDVIIEKPKLSMFQLIKKKNFHH